MPCAQLPEKRPKMHAYILVIELRQQTSFGPQRVAALIAVAGLPMGQLDDQIATQVGIDDAIDIGLPARTELPDGYRRGAVLAADAHDVGVAATVQEVAVHRVGQVGAFDERAEGVGELRPVAAERRLVELDPFLRDPAEHQEKARC